MDDSSERRLSIDRSTQQKHLNMLEQIAILLGSNCIAKNVKTYADRMKVQNSKAFKIDGQQGLDNLLRVHALAGAVNQLLVVGRNSSWTTQQADTPNSLMQCGNDFLTWETQLPKS